MVSKEFSMAKKVLDEFYKISTVGSFLVPFRFLTEDVVDAIMQILREGYILGVIEEINGVEDVAECFYLLLNPKICTIREVNLTKDILMGELEKDGLAYSEELSMLDYSTYADTLDRVLKMSECLDTDSGISWGICLELINDCFNIREFSTKGCFKYKF